MSINSRKSKKGLKAGQTKPSLANREKQLQLALVPSYPRQVCWETWLPGLPSKQTTTVTTGVRASSFPVTKTSVAGFVTRFASTFVEYRIIRAKFKYRCFSSTTPGVSQVWVDEKSTANPTATEAGERAILSFPNSSVNQEHVMTWECSDTLDLQYIDIGTAVTVASFKLYTDNAVFGAPIAVTEFLEIVPFFQFQFRGLQAA
jgi:hypothetical protein